MVIASALKQEYLSKHFKMKRKGILILLLLIIIFQIIQFYNLFSLRKNDKVEKVSCINNNGQYKLELFYNKEVVLSGVVNRIESFNIETKNRSMLHSESFYTLNKSEFDLSQSISLGESIKIRYTNILFFFYRKDYIVSLTIKKSDEKCLKYSYSLEEVK